MTFKLKLMLIMKVKVLASQNMFDIAIEHTGSEKNAFIIATHNRKSVTEKLEAGSELEIPSTVSIDVQTLNYYKSRELHPATGVKKRANPPAAFAYEFAIQL